MHVQVCEHLQRVGKVCGVWAVPIVGGISPIKQERLLKKLPEVSHCYQCMQGTAALMILVQYSWKPLHYAYTLLPRLLVLTVLQAMEQCADAYRFSLSCFTGRQPHHLLLPKLV